MMKSTDGHFKQEAGSTMPHFSRWSGLQARMTISYIWVTVVTVFILTSLYAGLLTGMIGYTLSQEKMGVLTHFPPLTTYPVQGALVMIMVILLVAPVIGGLFGTMTTRGMVGRVRKLVTATTQFAHGKYAQRVRVTRNDEIGQLEAQFNRMAEQLEESIAQREMLADQNARLAERARISRELHDAISQDLFSLRMLADGLHMALPEDSDLQPQIVTLEQTATNMIREMRALLLEMRPTQLAHLGLAAALEDLAASYRTRLGITVTTTIALVLLEDRVERTLLRIAQETLSNAVRHGDAKVITLSLAPQEDTIVFSIVDNGKGFSLEEGLTQHGLGLRLMQERVHELHGGFELKTTPGQGTCIQVCLPITGANI